MNLRRELLKQCLLLGAITLAAGGAAWLLHPRAPRYDPSLDRGEISLDSLPAGGRSIMWVDARSAGAFEQDHIPGALLLNEDDWFHLLDAFMAAWSQEKLVIVYCGSNGCHDSKLVAQRLKNEMGIANVYLLKEGWEGWLERRQSPEE